MYVESSKNATNVKDQRLIPDHEKVMTADGKCIEGLNIFIFSN